MKRLTSFLTLFTSLGTLICCALPALFVVLGFGAAFAGLVGSVPQLIWFSEHKLIVFGTGGIFLIVGGIFQYRNKKVQCPIDPALNQACKTTRDWSLWVYLTSVVLYAIGVGFAFRY